MAELAWPCIPDGDGKVPSLGALCAQSPEAARHVTVLLEEAGKHPSLQGDVTFQVVKTGALGMVCLPGLVRRPNHEYVILYSHGGEWTGAQAEQFRAWVQRVRAVPELAWVMIVVFNEGGPAPAELIAAARVPDTPQMPAAGPGVPELQPLAPEGTVHVLSQDYVPAPKPETPALRPLAAPPPPPRELPRRQPPTREEVRREQAQQQTQAQQQRVAVRDRRYWLWVALAVIALGVLGTLAGLVIGVARSRSVTLAWRHWRLRTPARVTARITKLEQELARRNPGVTEWHVRSQVAPAGESVQVDLDLSGHAGLRDLYPLLGLPLTSLNLAGTAVTDLGDVEQPGLRTLWLDDCQAFQAPAQLGRFTALERLSVPATLDGFDFLSALTQLQWVSCRHWPAGAPPAPDARTALVQRVQEYALRGGTAALSPSGEDQQARPAPTPRPSTAKGDEDEWQEVPAAGDDGAATPAPPAAPAPAADASAPEPAAEPPVPEVAAAATVVEVGVVQDALTRGLPRWRDHRFHFVASPEGWELNLSGDALVTNLSVTGLPELAEPTLGALRVLDLGGTGVNELGPLAPCGLTSLVLAKTKVVTVTPLHRMPLRYLDLSGTAVRDVAPVARPTLQVLLLDGCLGIAALKPLLACQDLQWLSFPTTALDVAALRALPHLAQLHESRHVQDERTAPGGFMAAAAFWADFERRGRVGMLAGGPGGSALPTNLPPGWIPLDASFRPLSAKRVALLFDLLRARLATAGAGAKLDQLRQDVVAEFLRTDGCPSPPSAPLTTEAQCQSLAKTYSAQQAPIRVPPVDVAQLRAEAERQFPMYHEGEVVTIRYLLNPGRIGDLTGEFHYLSPGRIQIGRRPISIDDVDIRTPKEQLQLNPPVAEKKRAKFMDGAIATASRQRDEARRAAYREGLAQAIAANEKNGYIFFAGEWLTPVEVVTRMLQPNDPEPAPAPPAAP